MAKAFASSTRRLGGVMLRCPSRRSPPHREQPVPSNERRRTAKAFITARSLTPRKPPVHQDRPAPRATPSDNTQSPGPGGSDAVAKTRSDLWRSPSAPLRSRRLRRRRRVSYDRPPMALDAIRKKLRLLTLKRAALANRSDVT